MTPDGQSTWSLVGAVAAAGAASACCTIPLAFVYAGVGGAWLGGLAVLEPMRPLFVTMAVAGLGFSAQREWKMSQKSGCDCDSRLPAGLRRGMLALAAVTTGLLIVSPSIITASSTIDLPTPSSNLVETVGLERVVLHVEGMTCAGCTVTVERALIGLAGVREVVVSYEPPETVVVYHPAEVSLEALTTATAAVGYPSKPGPAEQK